MICPRDPTNDPAKVPTTNELILLNRFIHFNDCRTLSILSQPSVAMGDPGNRDVI